MTALVASPTTSFFIPFFKSTWLVIAVGLGIIAWLYQPATFVEMEPAVVVADQCVEDIDD